MFGQTTALGIEFGTHAVRAALIQKHGDAYRVNALVSEKYGGNSLTDALRLLKKRLRKNIKAPWQWPSQQVLGVPQSKVVLKRIAVPTDLPENEQFIQVGMMLAESLGLPMDELLYDYRVLPNGEGVEVYACRKVTLKDSLDALSEAGFHLSVIELQAHALMRLHQHHSEKGEATGTELFVDISHERMQICLGDNLSDPFFRELPLPNESLGADSLLGRNRYAETLADTIQRQYQLAATQFPGKHVSNLMLSGEGLSDVDALHLEAHLSWHVETFNPLMTMSLTQKLVEGLDEPTSTWTTAIGLALRGMDDATVN
ncbi:type IV pilus biogenesis protein PilM [Enterovibrio norvegicus]|uniref:type IV pilus biogenesis protein PilM n=1 Tax=Enterovibrio norvegicus TaxID=188144 RepID=UPI0013D57D99|nr:pilus assembly protein PilM [Enterovibrio norvegicus]